MVERDVADEGGEAPCFAHLLPDERLEDISLADLVRTLADAVVVADANGVIRFWNGAATRLFGWEEAQALGEALDLIIPERLRQRHWDGYHRVMSTGHTDYGDRVLEVPAMHRDGHRMSIAFTVTLMSRTGEEGPWAIAAVIRDDSERWQERRELREKAARASAVDPRAPVDGLGAGDVHDTGGPSADQG